MFTICEDFGAEYDNDNEFISEKYIYNNLYVNLLQFTVYYVQIGGAA